MQITNEMLENGFDNLDSSEFQDDFSLKKLGKKIGNAAKKVGKAIGNVGKFAVLLPLQPVMVAVLKTKGIKASLLPNKLEQTSELFYNNVVRKSNGFEDLPEVNLDNFDEYERDNITGEIVEAIVSFVRTQMKKKKEGKALPPALDQIAKTGIKIEEKGTEVATKEVEGTVGNKVLKFAPWIIGGIVLVIIAVTFLATRK